MCVTRKSIKRTKLQHFFCNPISFFKWNDFLEIFYISNFKNQRAFLINTNTLSFTVRWSSSLIILYPGIFKFSNNINFLDRDICEEVLNYVSTDVLFIFQPPLPNFDFKNNYPSLRDLVLFAQLKEKHLREIFTFSNVSVLIISLIRMQL